MPRQGWPQCMYRKPGRRITEHRSEEIECPSMTTRTRRRGGWRREQNADVRRRRRLWAGVRRCTRGPRAT